MSYTAYQKPRPETISEDGIEGIIDIANLSGGSSRKIESNPEAFFSLTYPTSDVLKVIEQINTRFVTDSKSSGLFLFEGLKGSGKSHLLLLIYNLFKYPDIAQKWLNQNNLECTIPTDFIVAINKFTDNPHDAVWDMIFASLGKEVKKGKTHPKLTEFEQAIGDKKLILIFDELEQGIKVISDSALQAQNIAFLQMLSEFSNRSKQVTLFASIYSDREEPGSTLKRGARCSVQFDNSKDRCNVILHRLFENYMTFNREDIKPVIDSYVQLWQKHVPIDAEDLKGRFRETYPFSPSLMDILLKRIPSKGGFQNVRGAITFLGNLVRLTHEKNDIITPADASLEDRANTIMLRDLDISGDLINRAIENMDELRPRVPIATVIASSVLLYTLTSLGSQRGVSRDALVSDILSPTVDINIFNQALMSFQKYASYFHSEVDRFYFDLEEQPEAKVEYKSLPYEDDFARELIVELTKNEIFKETTSAVVYTSPDQTKQLLNQFEKGRPRYVLAGRRLTQEERHNIYHGMDVRNLILLLEPKDENFQLLSDRDLLKWAKRVKAARELVEGSRSASPKKADYERIARTDQSYIIERIKKSGLVFVHWDRYSEAVNDDKIELEPISGDGSKERVLSALNEDYFPMLIFKEHLEARLDEIKDKLVKEIDAEYRATLGFPVPANVRAITNAIRELCREGIIGIQHSRGNYCRKNPDLSETEFFSAKIISPFDEQPISTPQQPPSTMVCPNCAQRSCICATPTPETVICPSCGKDPCACPKRETISLRIPPKTSIGGLREDAAVRLQQYEGAEITKVNYKIFYQQTNIGDISTLPAAIRGNLNGQGDVTAEISITKTGRFSKSQVEHQIESLPSISGADYSADITLEVEKKGA
jgi:hypothetical protein